MTEYDDYIKNLSSYEWDESLKIGYKTLFTILITHSKLKCYNLYLHKFEKQLGYKQRKYTKLIFYYYWGYKRK